MEPVLPRPVTPNPILPEWRLMSKSSVPPMLLR